jgi:hypothetical protein
MQKHKFIEAAFESWWHETYSEALSDTKRYSADTMKAVAKATWVASLNRNR